MLNIFDTGHPWVLEMQRAAVDRKFPCRLVKPGQKVEGGLGFFIPRQIDKSKLMRDKLWFEELREQGHWFIQDAFQVRAYEDKIAQFHKLSRFMPVTRYASTWTQAVELIEGAEFPLISKSAYGSASHNVRLLNSRTEGFAELIQLFDQGLNSRRGKGPDVPQQDYALWQEFIHHEWTWRVTLVGTKYHVYKRFNYPDRPMAAPSCVVETQPAEMNEEVHSLLNFSKEVLAYADTKFCAIDVLKTGRDWALLETSLAWARGPDPSGRAFFYGTSESLMTQFSLLISEIKAGVFGEC